MSFTEASWDNVFNQTLITITSIWIKLTKNSTSQSRRDTALKPTIHYTRWKICMAMKNCETLSPLRFFYAQKKLLLNALTKPLSATCWKRCTSQRILSTLTYTMMDQTPLKNLTGVKISKRRSFSWKLIIIWIITIIWS